MANTFRTDLTKDEIAEKTRRRVLFDVLDDQEQPLDGGRLDFMNYDLYNEKDGAAINSHTGQDGIAGGDITVDSGGKGVLVLLPADNPIVGTSDETDPDQEVHVAELFYQWDLDAEFQGRHKIRVQVVNLVKTT